ncbi:MAG: glycosyltransferase family 2 protein [Geminicoccaceae bacterium]|nr:glycosyltransferase family 2 protein [Geminicoccaceae bacterium]MCB9944846.1 glycosyltransferase family 2 protein [Geminicoccaceae bacterium]
MTALPGVSIIVDNFNSERFIAEAIDSALAQDHDRTEVIIVDDGSTDGSRGIIERYANRATIVLMPENGGQVSAINAAWPKAQYEIVIFLDGDDVLMPFAASTIASYWQPGLSKMQYCLLSIDENHRSLGHVAPKYPENLDTETIRREILRTGSYPCPQACGNAYARTFLEALAPIGGLRWMDMILEVNAPFYGEIFTLPKALACYRIHDNNDSAQVDYDTGRFARYASIFEEKLDYLESRCRLFGLEFDGRAARSRALWYLELKLTEAKLEERRVYSYWRGLSRAVLALGAVFRSPHTPRQRVFRAVWLVLVALSPRIVAIWLIRLRYIVPERPHLIEKFVGIKLVSLAMLGLMMGGSV